MNVIVVLQYFIKDFIFEDSNMLTKLPTETQHCFCKMSSFY